MEKIFDAVVISPLGKIGIKTSGEKLTHISFLSAASPTSAPSNPVAKDAASQLDYYFRNPNFSFSLPLNPEGTPFQLSVWELLKTIPLGATLTYGGLAQKLATSSRAIGGACRRNPLPIVIPCHRIIAAQNLGGYSGAKTGELFKIKEWLLKHEGINF